MTRWPMPTGTPVDRPFLGDTCARSFTHPVDPGAMPGYQWVWVVLVWPLGDVEWTQRYGPVWAVPAT